MYITCTDHLLMEFNRQLSLLERPYPDKITFGVFVAPNKAPSVVCGDSGTFLVPYGTILIIQVSSGNGKTNREIFDDFIEELQYVGEGIIEIDS